MSGPPARGCNSRGNQSRLPRRQSPRLPAILGLLRRWRAGSPLARSLECPSPSRRSSPLTSASHLAGADRSDAINVDPDHSAAYMILKTDLPDGLEGHGLTFTSGRGNELCVAAI